MNRVGIIGLGNISLRHQKNIQALYPESQLYLMSASGRPISSDELGAAVAVDSIDAMVALKPDFVIVSSPASCHAEHAIPLIKNSIPVLIEKPVTSSLADADRILSEMNHNSKVGVGYCLRYMPSASKFKDLIDSQFVGSIHNIRIDMGQYLPEWRPSKDFMSTVSVSASLGGGALLELSHEFDYAQWIFGPLTPLHSILRHSSELSLEVEDIADIVLETSQGAVINMHLDFLQKRPTRTCIVWGEKGRLEWNLLENSITYVGRDGEQACYSNAGWDRNEMYLNMMRDFNDSHTDRSDRLASLEQARSIVGLIDQVKDIANSDKG